MSQKAKTISRRLFRENRGTRKNPGRSWRVIAREDYADKIPAGTLNRIALSDGEWYPKDEQSQIILGLKRERKAQHQSQPKDLFDMSTAALRKALEDREPMPPVDPRIVKCFQKLGWLEKVTQ